MALISFTDNFADNSTEAGFQFTFYCDLCQEGYKTQFIESKTYKKTGLLRGLGKALSIGATVLGRSGVGSTIERGTDILTERFEGMSPEWHKEHEQAFRLAQNEAKGHFHRCPKCTKWLCENDWNEQEGLCTECAPRESVEVASAKAEKMVEDIKAKATQKEVFKGEIERRQTLCPQCGKPSGAGKFCNDHHKTIFLFPSHGLIHKFCSLQTGVQVGSGLQYCDFENILSLLKNKKPDIIFSDCQAF